MYLVFYGFRVYKFEWHLPFLLITFGQVTIDMSKEVSNSQEETTCDDNLNVGFDDCFTDVSSIYWQILI